MVTKVVGYKAVKISHTQMRNFCMLDLSLRCSSAREISTDTKCILIIAGHITQKCWGHREEGLGTRLGPVRTTQYFTQHNQAMSGSLLGPYVPQRTCRERGLSVQNCTPPTTTSAPAVSDLP